LPTQYETRTLASHLHQHPELLQTGGQDPRYVHLRDLEFVGYLTLGEVFIEPEMEDSPFSFRAGLDQRLERVEVLDQFHPIVDVAEGVESGSSIDSHLGFEGVGAVSTTQ